MVCISKYFDKAGQIFTGQKSSEIPDPLEKELWRAKEEWDNACSYFNQVADPDLIEYAIFAMQAAERKYMYLLKVIKKEQGYYRDYDYDEEIVVETDEVTTKAFERRDERGIAGKLVQETLDFSDTKEVYTKEIDTKEIKEVIEEN